MPRKKFQKQKKPWYLKQYIEPIPIRNPLVNFARFDYRRLDLGHFTYTCIYDNLTQKIYDEVEYNEKTEYGNKIIVFANKETIDRLYYFLNEEIIYLPSYEEEHLALIPYIKPHLYIDPIIAIIAKILFGEY